MGASSANPSFSNAGSNISCTPITSTTGLNINNEICELFTAITRSINFGDSVQVELVDILECLPTNLLVHRIQQGNVLDGVVEQWPKYVTVVSIEGVVCSFSGDEHGYGGLFSVKGFKVLPGPILRHVHLMTIEIQGMSRPTDEDLLNVLGFTSKQSWMV